jgi:hypothetical protein
VRPLTAHRPQQISCDRPAVTSPFVPDFLLAGGTVDLPADVPALALRALDRITADKL